MHGLEHGLFQSVRRLVHHQQHLPPIRTRNRGDQPPTDRQLLTPLGRDRRATCGSHNASVGGSLDKAQHSIPKKQVHIGQAQRAQMDTGLVVQATQALDAVDLAGQPAQDRRLVAASGVNFQHAPE